MNIVQTQIVPGGALATTSLVDQVLRATSGLRLSAQNPWPGLETYNEAARDFFKGRASETAELLRLIRLAPLTVLYGKSGLGKSSLLQSGVFHELRAQHFLPVYLRIDFSPSAQEAPLDQVAQRLDAELRLNQIEAPARDAGENLWRYLHRNDLEIWSSDSFLLTPVLVFDQFEEVFSRSADDAERVQQMFDGLADLIENRIPADLATDQRTHQAKERRAHRRYDLLGQRYRIVLSFREDFLPEVESWKDRVPSLLRNRMRLLPMQRGQAIAAVQEAGAAVLASGMAERIVDFVGRGAEQAAGTAASVEPVLLSLCCAQLNRRRPPDGLIDAALLDHAGEDILESFYQEALQGLPVRVAQFIEDHLVQGTRFRGSYPRAEALAEGHLTRDELERLTTTHRLLRVEHQNDTPRIELIHDRLVGIVRKARDQRLAVAQEQRLREQAQAEAEREREKSEGIQKERARERSFSLKLMVAVGLLFVTSAVTVWYAIQADRQTKAAQAAKKAAEAATEQATAFRLVAQSRSLLAELQAGGDELAIQQLLAAHRLAPLSASVDGAMLDAVVGSERLLKVMHNEARVLSVAFSPDGQRLVSGSMDNTLRLWDVHSGKPIGAPMQGHEKSVTSVAFSPDGKRLVSGSYDKTLRLWDAQSGQSIGAPLQGHTDIIRSVAFSPDGQHLVSGSDDETLRLWDAHSGQPIGAPLKGHTGIVESVAFSPDGRRLVSGSWDKTLRLWDARSGQPVGEPLEGHTDIVLSVAFSPDGQRLVSGSYDKTLRLWDAHSGQPIGEQEHKRRVLSVAFSPDGQRLASGSDDNTLRLWDAQSGLPVGEPLQGHTGTVLSVAFSPDGRRLVSGSVDGTLRVWDAQSGPPIGAPLQGHTDGVTSVAFSPDGRRLVSGSLDRTLRLWDAQSGQPIGVPLQGHTDNVLGVAFSPDGQRLVSGSLDNTLRLWDAQSGLPIGVPLQGHTGMVLSVAFSPDGQRLISGSHDKTLRLWDARGGQPIGGPLQGHKDRVMSVVFSPDGRRLVSGSWDNTLRLWDAHSGKPIGPPLQWHKHRVMGVAFSPDGRRLVSGSWDETLRLWDADGGQPIGAPLRGHQGGVTSVAFSPDGQRLVSGSMDRTLRLWPAPPALPALLCAKLTRNLSPAQWRDWVSADIPYRVQCPDLPIPE